MSTYKDIGRPLIDYAAIEEIATNTKCITPQMLPVRHLGALISRLQESRSVLGATVALRAEERYLNGLSKENLPNAIKAVHTNTVSEALSNYMDSVVLDGRPLTTNDGDRSLLRETSSV